MNKIYLQTIVSEAMLQEIDITLSRYEITTPLRIAHFLAQIKHESGDFKHKEENLNYSSRGLLLTFPKYFNGQLANEYEKQPERIANRVYANRYGNGPEESGDGWKYRGRGFIMITFRANYESLGKRLGIDLVKKPELLLIDMYAWKAAGAFWTEKKLNELADQGSEGSIVEKITKKINGGINGLQERKENFITIYEGLV